MTVTAARVYLYEDGFPAVPYTALIGWESTLVRYYSIMYRDRHFDVLRLPHGGDPAWLSQWSQLWSEEARRRLVADVRALAPRRRPSPGRRPQGSARPVSRWGGLDTGTRPYGEDVRPGSL